VRTRLRDVERGQVDAVVAGQGHDVEGIERLRRGVRVGACGQQGEQEAQRICLVGPGVGVRHGDQPRRRSGRVGRPEPVQE
jgi:hypothetical protein